MLGLLVYFWFRPPAWVSEQAQPVSAFTVQLIDMRTVSSDSLRGKVVLVNFWATWCPFCRHEMPAMESFYREYKDQGVEILAISIENDAALVRQFMAGAEYTFPQH
jgi:thiol-disulfide isomerase/thioredoxin